MRFLYSGYVDTSTNVFVDTTWFYYMMHFIFYQILFLWCYCVTGCYCVTVMSTIGQKCCVSLCGGVHSTL